VRVNANGPMVFPPSWETKSISTRLPSTPT
jgi:hypothetical protein